MTPAEYRAAIAALGTSAETVAAFAGVHQNSVLRWSHMSRELDVPPRAAEAMQQMLAARDEAVVALIAETEARGLGAIPWHIDLDAFYAACGSVEGWGIGTQAQVILEAQRRLAMPVEYAR